MKHERQATVIRASAAHPAHEYSDMMFSEKGITRFWPHGKRPRPALRRDEIDTVIAYVQARGATIMSEWNI